MRHMRPCRCASLLITTALCAGVAGCQSAAPRDSSSPPGARPGISDEPATQDQAAGMAADDAEALRLQPTATQPARRPPRPAERRAVDQPRVSGRRTSIRR